MVKSTGIVAFLAVDVAGGSGIGRKMSGGARVANPAAIRLL